VARDCQWEAEASARPTWCGKCDRQTRLIDHGSYAQRCHLCWAWPDYVSPDGRHKGTRFHQLLPQHKLCGGCRNIIYEFDNMPCGKHRPLAIDAAGRRLLPEPPPTVAVIAAGTRRAIAKEDT
jgi:hypothetical protein